MGAYGEAAAELGNGVVYKDLASVHEAALVGSEGGDNLRQFLDHTSRAPAIQIGKKGGNAAVVGLAHMN